MLNPRPLLGDASMAVPLPKVSSPLRAAPQPEGVKGPLQGPHLAHILLSASRPPWLILTWASHVSSWDPDGPTLNSKTHLTWVL